MTYRKISNEKREMIIRWYEEGKTISEIIILVPEIPRTTINSIIKKFNDTGNKIKSIRGGARIVKLTPEILEETKLILQENCSKSLKEIKQEIFEKKGVTLAISSVHIVCKGINFTFKKPVLSPIARNTPQTIDKRYNYALNFIELQGEYADEEFFFLDEVGFALSLRRSYGRSKIGTSQIKPVSLLKSRNLSVCATMSISGFYFYQINDSPYNKESFLIYLEKLILYLRENNILKGVLVMDNVRFHHCFEIENLITNNNFKILFLPPYSPFMNPIENSFSKWKEIIKSSNPETEEDLIFQINNAVGLFNITDFLGYWRRMIRNIRKSIAKEEIFE